MTLPVEQVEIYRRPTQGIPEDVYWCREGGVFNPINYVRVSDATVITDSEPVQSKLSLLPIFAPMKFADTVRCHHDGVGERFDFSDRTGHVHGEYRKGDRISPAPDHAIGAVKVGEAWFWVIQGPKS